MSSFKYTQTVNEEKKVTSNKLKKPESLLIKCVVKNGYKTALYCLLDDCLNDAQIKE